MTVQIEKRGEFHSHQHWVNKASSWLPGTGYTCVDTKGRVCHNGGDMQRAHDEGAFPVSFGPRLDKVKRLEWFNVDSGQVAKACEFDAVFSLTDTAGPTIRILRDHRCIFGKKVNGEKHGKDVARKWFRKRGVLEDKAVRKSSSE